MSKSQERAIIAFLERMESAADGTCEVLRLEHGAAITARRKPMPGVRMEAVSTDTAQWPTYTTFERSDSACASHPADLPFVPDAAMTLAVSGEGDGVSRIATWTVDGDVMATLEALIRHSLNEGWRVEKRLEPGAPLPSPLVALARGRDRRALSCIRQHGMVSLIQTTSPDVP